MLACFQNAFDYYNEKYLLLTIDFATRYPTWNSDFWLQPYSDDLQDLHEKANSMMERTEQKVQL